ncbi:MAG: hypothetical protein EBR34_15580 [Sphingomonadaceae bacterium]|nr:hypothetical protein [Sphingomonadaceae bacterium]
MLLIAYVNYFFTFLGSDLRFCLGLWLRNFLATDGFWLYRNLTWALLLNGIFDFFNFGLSIGKFRFQSCLNQRILLCINLIFNVRCLLRQLCKFHSLILRDRI